VGRPELTESVEGCKFWASLLRIDEASQDYDPMRTASQVLGDQKERFSNSSRSSKTVHYGEPDGTGFELGPMIIPSRRLGESLA
jgi:hypothetical protein